VGVSSFFAHKSPGLSYGDILLLCSLLFLLCFCIFHKRIILAIFYVYDIAFVNFTIFEKKQKALYFLKNLK